MLSQVFRAAIADKTTVNTRDTYGLSSCNVGVLRMNAQRTKYLSTHIYLMLSDLNIGHVRLFYSVISLVVMLQINLDLITWPLCTRLFTLAMMIMVTELI